MTDERRRLVVSFFFGLTLEILLLTAAGFREHWLAPLQVPSDNSNFVEAQIFEVPVQTHLLQASPPLKVRAPHELTLSKVPEQGRAAKPDESLSSTTNQTSPGPSANPNHGPVAVYSPAPHLPGYLQDKDLHASVVMDFSVSALGQTTVKLVNSSGNEELDALALQTAVKWQFRPAEKDHQAVDAKVRLRIVFEVE